MISLETIKMILYFLNPFYIIGKGWLAIFDILTFIVVPYILLKTYYKTSWRRAILFYCGFMISQISMLNNPGMEYVLELGGILLMIGACIWKKEENVPIKTEKD